MLVRFYLLLSVETLILVTGLYVVKLQISVNIYKIKWHLNSGLVWLCTAVVRFNYL